MLIRLAGRCFIHSNLAGHGWPLGDFMDLLNWITANGSPRDLIVIAVTYYAFIIQRKQIDDLKYKYSQVDKLTFGIAIAIQKAKGIKLTKQSANGVGDNALNRDVV